MPEFFFNLINILPLPLWLSMILFPKTRFTERLVMSYWPFIVLGGVYVLCLLVSFGSAPGFGFSFEALRMGLSSDWGFVTGWAHFIAFDVFVGVWIFRDAKYFGLNVTVFLILTLFAGPLGLAAYLLYRQRLQKRNPGRVVN